MDANETVTVIDAYDNQLWKTGTLLVHNYGKGFEVIDIAGKNSDGMYHLKGRANMCYAWGSDALDYTPATPVDELTALREQLAAAQAERDTLKAALEGVLKFADITTEERNNRRDMTTYTEVKAELHLNNVVTSTSGNLGEDNLANALYQAHKALRGGE